MFLSRQRRQWPLRPPGQYGASTRPVAAFKGFAWSHRYAPSGDVPRAVLPLWHGHHNRRWICYILFFRRLESKLIFILLLYQFIDLDKSLQPLFPKRSKLQALPFFTHIPSYARESATVRMPWNKTANMPGFTGMPPHVSILAQLEEVKVRLNSLTPMDVDLRPLFLGLRKFVITSRIFVLKASWRHQNVAEVVSYNRGISHLHSACRIDDIFRFPFRVTKITIFISKKVW